MWFCVIACVLLLVATVSAYLEIHRITRQLKTINRDQSNSIIRLVSTNAILEDLANEINKTLHRQEDQSRRLKEQDDKLKQSIADISHDFCTPLTSISGYLQLLQSDTEYSETDRQYISNALRKADYLNTLLKNYFDLSVYESSSFTLEQKKINICELVSLEILNDDVDFQKRGLEVTAQLPDYGIWILGDQVAYQRIVQNLLGNAIRYSQSKLEIVVYEQEDRGVLCATNDAAELTEQEIKCLFERFYTVDRARGTTGLGLYIVKTLSEKMGGSAACDYRNGSLSISVEMPSYHASGR